MSPWRFSISPSKNSSTRPHCRHTRWSWCPPWFSSNTALPVSKCWRESSPACSNCVSTRYTVASPMSMPSAIRLRYTSSAERWRTLLFSNSSSTLRRGSVALRPMSLRLCAELIDYHYRPMFRAPILLLALQLAGCGWLAPYRIDIKQGNFVSQEMVAQLKRGMTKEQVRFVLGTPLVTDIFHADRWDYVYLLDRPGGPRGPRGAAPFFSGGQP